MQSGLFGQIVPDSVHVDVGKVANDEYVIIFNIVGGQARFASDEQVVEIRPSVPLGDQFQTEDPVENFEKVQDGNLRNPF